MEKTIRIIMFLQVIAGFSAVYYFGWSYITIVKGLLGI